MNLTDCPGHIGAVWSGADGSHPTLHPGAPLVDGRRRQVGGAQTILKAIIAEPFYHRAF